MSLTRWLKRSLSALALLSLLAAPVAEAASPAEDRFLIMELMDRYGVVHDLGTAEEYADLFTEDGEIASGRGQPPRLKGRDAILAQTKLDNARFAAPPGPDGRSTSIMRHIISNRSVTLTGRNTAEGSSYVLTLINDATEGPVVFAMGRYEDVYARTKDGWRIARRVILMESTDPAVAKKYGFTR